MPSKQTISLFTAAIIGFMMTRQCNGAAEERSIQRSQSTSDMSRVTTISTSTKIPQLTRRGSASPVPAGALRPQSATGSPTLDSLQQLQSAPLLSLKQQEAFPTASQRRFSDTTLRGPSQQSTITRPRTMSFAEAAVTSTTLDPKEVDDAEDETDDLPTLRILLTNALTDLQQLDSTTSVSRSHSITQEDQKEKDDSRENSNVTEQFTKLEEIITANSEKLTVVEGDLQEEKERVNREVSFLVKTTASVTAVVSAYLAYSYYQAKQETLRKIRMITGFEIPVALSAFKSLSAPLMTAFVAGIGWWRFKNSITRPLQRKFEKKVDEQNEQIRSLAAKQRETAAQILLVFAAIKQAQKQLHERNMQYLGQINSLQLELINTQTITGEMKQTIKKIRPVIEAMAQTVQKLAQTDTTKKSGLFGATKKNKPKKTE